ncbi:MAG: peptidoglycan DD-metalloendopeptidase family protein [Oscillibacter sp.]|nr:peptidoglycan DD-metalloendopeptidase family protein [Oscillibacter sp.]
MIFSRLTILFSVFFCSCSVVCAQSVNDIKKQKEKTEKEISYLNKLLGEATKNKSVSTEKLYILQEKIVQSKNLLNSLNQEVSYIQKDILKNEKRISELQTEKNAMLELYSKLVYGTWKKRNKANKLMFIFSSSDFNQAYNRFKYFQQLQEYSGRQLELIRQVDDSLNLKNRNLASLVSQKNAVLNTIRVKNQELESEKLKENQYVAELQKKEKDLKKKLQNETQRQQRLAKELNRLVSKQIKKSGSTSPTKYKLTPEEKLLSDDFAKNKGRLPWPVVQGFISRKFGLSVNPIHKRVTEFYDGIKIMTSKNADVRAVFQGVVSDIAYESFLNNIVLIRHGNYVTVYGNVTNLTVKKGDKVNTKDIIGKVGYDPEEGSVLIFHLCKDIEKQNPELWLAK